MCLITLLFTPLEAKDSFYEGHYIVCIQLLINSIGMMPSLLKTTEKSTSMVKININEKLYSFNNNRMYMISKKDFI